MRELTERENETMLWYKQLRETNNEGFVPLFFDQHRYLVLKGGGGSGKSVFAARKVMERCATEPGHRWLVCRKVGETIRESCFKLLSETAHSFYEDEIEFIPRGKSAAMYIRLKNGSEILFTGLDDVEKIKSIQNITGIWIEEASELSRGDFNQLDIRLRPQFPYYSQIILSFNPISVMHWLKERFFDTPDPRARVHESTYKGNRFLPAEYVRTLEAFKETDPYYYMVYALNQWGVTGRTVFNGAALTRRLEELRQRGEPRQGFFSYTENPDGIHVRDAQFHEEKDAPIRVYREPEPGRPYVIGGDTAGDGSDWFVAQVLDNITGEQVATLRHQYDEDTYAKQLYCLGQYYNDALIGVEVNFSTYPVKLLNLMGYPKLYIREIEDEFDGKIKRAYGFATTALTRPVIVGDLIRIMREGTRLVNDEETVLEMMSFIRNDKLRAEAEEGAHDDTVMALAIAYYIRPQQSMSVTVPDRKVTAKWTADMWQDYQRAGSEARQMMLERWGTPTR